MTVELMAAQAFLFFVAGFETSSGVLSHCLMELSKHADVQEKLYREITEVLTKNDYNVTHDLLHQIPYLDQVIYGIYSYNTNYNFSFTYLIENSPNVLSALLCDIKYIVKKN